MHTQHDETVRAAFHKAWGEAQECDDYDKGAWMKVQVFLDPTYNNLKIEKLAKARANPRKGPAPRSGDKP